MIDPKDVIRQHSVESLNETADEYFRRIVDPTPLMAKPFAFLHETPEMLENLGRLLAGLHLGKTMVVLDFGAGTGWLSRFLAQLNCQPICCDVSAAALAIGERLLEELPLVGTAAFRPRFTHFDGHRLDLPDESVDRVICFDAFHHVPNQARILAEFGRVLRPGGIAGFSEPGREHSATPQSQYEMRNHRVLENDIVLEDIAALARNTGFTDVRVKVVTDDMDVSLDEYLCLVGARQNPSRERDELRDDLYNRAHNGTVTRSIFFLHKGPIRRDSRSHLGLAHRIVPGQTDVRATARVPFVLRFHLANTGAATWLATNDEIFGVVRLGSHLYDSEERLLDVDFSRHGLVRSVEPGATEDLEIQLTMNSPGRYRMGFDLVAEGVTWFENVGSEPVYVTVDVA